MRLFKPEVLAALFKVIGSERGMLLTFTTLAAFTFDETAPQRLLPEKDLWALASACLDKDEVLDWSFPKPEAEFLVYGACFPARPERATQVRAAVAEKVKTLDVYGDRTWDGDRPGRPEPFRSMPLDWRHAYGGPDFPDNPLGKGHGQAGTLPNILPPGFVPTSPKAACPVAGVTALRPHWPRRKRHFGPFDKKWLAERWPYYPRGTSLEYSMTAPEDQRLGRFFVGDERLVVHNMHPTRPVLESGLPKARVRLFLNRRKDGAEVFSERRCLPDTLWIFPEREAGVLAWRTMTLIEDEDAEDVLQCLIAVESLDAAPRPLESYRQELAARLAPPSPKPVLAPAPPAASRPAPEPPSPAAQEPPSQAVQDLQATAAELERLTDERLAGLGTSRDQVLARLRVAQAEPPAQNLLELLQSYEGPHAADPERSLADLESLAASVEERVEVLLAQAGMTRREAERQLAASLGASSDDPEALLATLLARPDLPETARSAFAEAARAFAELRQALEAPSAASTETPAGARRTPSASSASLTVEEVLARRARGESLRGLDLRGLDFSGRELSGADFSGCRLEGAVFAGANLERAVFVESRLSKARFEGALARWADFSDCLAAKTVFVRADLEGAALATADFSGADFSGARLAQAVLERTTFSGGLLAGADFRGARGRKTDFSKANLDGADLRQACLTDADLTGASCVRADCRKADLPGLRLAGAACAGVRFKGSSLGGLRADAATDLRGADFRAADLARAAMAGARLGGACLKRAVLTRANLVKADLAGACLRKADLSGARLDKADLSGADLTKANGFRACLRKARLADCRLTKAMLFGADLYKCVLSHAELGGANLTRTLLDPRTLDHVP